MLPTCDECMSSNSVAMRQSMGCGFEAPIEQPSDVWAHKGMDFESKHCPVYTTALPEVHDVALAVGSCGESGLVTLPVLCGGANPPRALIAGCQLLKASAAAQVSWKTDPKNKAK